MIRGQQTLHCKRGVASVHLDEVQYRRSGDEEGGTKVRVPIVKVE